MPRKPKYITSATMIKTKLPVGHMFINMAKLGQKPRWDIVPKPDTWKERIISRTWVKTSDGYIEVLQ